MTIYNYHLNAPKFRQHVEEMRSHLRGPYRAEFEKTWCVILNQPVPVVMRDLKKRVHTIAAARCEYAYDAMLAVKNHNFKEPDGCQTFKNYLITVGLIITVCPESGWALNDKFLLMRDDLEDVVEYLLKKRPLVGGVIKKKVDVFLVEACLNDVWRPYYKSRIDVMTFLN